MKKRFLKSSRIRAARPQVYAFHERPDALAKLAGGQPVKVVQAPKSLDPGSEVVLKTRILPFVWVKWVARHTACQPGYYFSDTQVKGPFRSWDHVHRFITTGPSETLMVDEIEYELPFGRLGDWLLGTWIHSELSRTFDARHQVLAQEFSGDNGTLSKKRLQIEYHDDRKPAAPMAAEFTPQGAQAG